jgi:hypothetical protein
MQLIIGAMAAIGIAVAISAPSVLVNALESFGRIPSSLEIPISGEDAAATRGRIRDLFFNERGQLR